MKYTMPLNNARILPKERTKEAIFDVINTLNLITPLLVVLALSKSMLDAALDDKDNNNLSYFSKSFAIFVSLGLLFLEIHHWRESKRNMNRTVSSMPEELNRSQTVIAQYSGRYRKAFHIFQPALSKVIVNPEKPYLAKTQLEFQKINGETLEIALTWDVRNEVLFKQMTRLKKLFTLLEKKYNVKDLPTYERSITERALPTNYILDMSSKRRALNLIGGIFSLINAGLSLTTLLDKIDGFDIAMLLLTIPVMSASSLVESLILGNTKYRNHLAGFKTYYPTGNHSRLFRNAPCIAGQLNQENIFYPDNSDLRRVVLFIVFSMQKLESIKTQLEYLPRPVTELIDEVKRDIIVREDPNQPDHLDLSFSDQQMLSPANNRNLSRLN